MQTDQFFSMLFQIVGGLGIFLFGMKNMSDGMQAIAGEKLRKMINAITNNRIFACTVGMVVTMLIQSSSITTVMTVGMVNAGLMKLTQAIGVVLGANIGTTVTAWILALKIGKYGLPILGIAAIFYIFSKRERAKFTATVVLGIGMIFFGLELMKDGFAPIRDMPEFIEWFHKFSPGDGTFSFMNYLRIWRIVLVGALLTAIVQSSSATIGITIGLAANGIIDYHTAAALVLGENIGTTITAFLASIGAGSNAKRASYAHMAVNILGVVWITILFWVYVDWVPQVIGADPTATAVGEDGKSMFVNAESLIAATHTGFNVANVLIFLPFTGLLAKLLNRIVPERELKTHKPLTVLDSRVLDAPALGIEQAQREILKMGERVSRMCGSLRHVLIKSEPDPRREEKIFSRERDLDLIQKEITEFLSNVLAHNLSHEAVNQGRNQLRMADEYESISDYITTILKLKLKMRDSDISMTDEGFNNIIDLHDHVAQYIGMINEGVRTGDETLIIDAQTKGKAITRLMKDYRAQHLERFGEAQNNPLKSLIYTDMLNAYRRMKDHAFNIAEILAGEK
ncbi:Na/Pi-cotransporter II-related protein [Anaerohalosphaera lusitana]|uniref:Na/Pi-cotransporter II-related protein n=1 Tax=Anaerohalosphaera lusitana TaxID=1936003 RepID=A0A1U9NNR0_9BACT|nr:Na/Pi cotransporter family protein [Anaerohalosphaera lusitana]AQT69529.1 Na/Pi-cotransporter II-related protein [Anaerohalosphaera lusitana]